MTRRRSVLIATVLVLVLLLALLLLVTSQPALGPAAMPGKTNTPATLPTETTVPAAAPTSAAAGAAADPVVLVIEPATTVVAEGEFFTLRVTAAKVEDLGAFEMALDYDPAVVAVTEMGVGNLVGSTGRNAVPLGPAIDNDSGRSSVGAFTFGDADGPSGEGTLASITFEARSAGTAAVSLVDVLVTDTRARTLPVEGLPEAVVTVEAP